MSDHLLHRQPAEPDTAPALDDDQRAYESLFGLVPEWHQAPLEAAPADDLSDDDLYRALFGA